MSHPPLSEDSAIKILLVAWVVLMVLPVVAFVVSIWLERGPK